MAAIQTVPGTLVQRAGSSGVAMRDTSALGLTKADAIGKVASAALNLAGNVYQERQSLIERGEASAQRIERANVQTEITKFAKSNPDKPEEWGRFADNAWKSYGAEVEKKSKEWRPAFRELHAVEAGEEIATYRKRLDIDIQTASIQKANTRIEQDATNLAENGQVDAAIQMIGGMTLRDDQRIDKVQNVARKAAVNQYTKTISDVGTLPPARALDEFSKMESEVVAKDDKGNFLAGSIFDTKGQRIGGLSEDDRINLIRHIRQQKNAQETAMYSTGKEIVRQGKAGADYESLFKQAYENGEITDKIASVFLPEIETILEERKAKQAAKEEAQQQAIAAKRDVAEQQVSALINRPTGSPITTQEIERRVQIGKERPNDRYGLTQEAGERLKAQLRAVELGDVSTEDYYSVEDKLNKKLGYGIFGGDRAQMTPADANAIIDDIKYLKISKGAKLKLMDKFFEVQRWDLQDKEIAEKDGDRDISIEEKNLRWNLIEGYRKNKTVLPPAAIGARYYEDMDEIGTWFRNNQNATPAQRAAKAEEFRVKMVRKLADDAAVTLIGDQYE